MADARRHLATRILWSYHGTFYIWGGDDPSAIDCSGLVIEILRSVGLYPANSDDTADGLLKRFKDKAVDPSQADLGTLVFWLDTTGKARHVEMIVDIDGEELYSMGASGGGPNVKTKEAAIAANAFVKVRPVAMRLGTTVYVDPFD